jgi:hypothetical protein
MARKSGAQPERASTTTGSPVSVAVKCIRKKLKKPSVVAMAYSELVASTAPEALMPPKPSSPQ